MKRLLIIILAIGFMFCISLSFKEGDSANYTAFYKSKLSLFESQQSLLYAVIEKSELSNPQHISEIKQAIHSTRTYLKGMDFWFRYLEPNLYKQINGPLPVEWETEVFEKFEKPYKREGSGLSLAELYLGEHNPNKDSLLKLIRNSITATHTFLADSTLMELKSFDHFYLCNRLFLLNLSSIYTTGFDCPDTAIVIAEMQQMLNDVGKIYETYNAFFPDKPISKEYLAIYENTLKFVRSQSLNFSQFNHFDFIKNYINPLFSLNQKMLTANAVKSSSYMDYTLSSTAMTIFDKGLYEGQNAKGIYFYVNDKAVLKEIEHVGKLLFYDPILSANNSRSCVSCHKPTQYFTDTTRTTSLQFNGTSSLLRNTPSLINSSFNHLLMLDGKHISLQDQGRDVITNPIEMGSISEEMVRKVMSCEEYAKSFKKWLKYTPTEKTVNAEHIVSAITLYYTKFSGAYSPFDEAMNGTEKALNNAAEQGFNTFMSKAKCGTCHFVPNFNGVKPPFIGSEFEVLGTPADTNYHKLSEDIGRFGINPTKEMLHAFRTGSIRNVEHTMPYMHNGVFSSLTQIVDFYDAGGGAGKGLIVNNQTLGADSLHLSKTEKDNLLAFMKSLNENIMFESPPSNLPTSSIKALNKRKVGGEY